MDRNILNPIDSCNDSAATVLQCTIQGTHNRYQMKKVTRANEMEKCKSRIASRKWDPSLYEIETQLQLLSEMWEAVRSEPVGGLARKQDVDKEQGAEEEQKEKERWKETGLHKKEHLLMKKELETKLSGYRFQDQHKKREGRNISLVETIEKLLSCRLVCYYCSGQCHVFYERVREMSQWSLDRIDNGLCHSVTNVVVSCLQCNLHRKNINSKKFKDTKGMHSIRLVDIQSTEKLEPDLPPLPPTTRTRFLGGKKSLQKLTDQVVVDERVVVPIQEEIP
jgi:hypothetical protein